MIGANEPLLVDGAGFRYEVRRSSRRRTIAIEVHPDLRVIVRAPAQVEAQVIARQVAERSRWIARAIERFRQASGPPPPARYHDGEPHLLMGEPHRLQLDKARLLALAAGIVAEWMGHFGARGHAAPTVRVRRMTTRWGSLADRRRMTLNLALARLPRECLEYVVVHELCHLEHRGHGPAFHGLMDRLLPDWRERRKRLMASRPVF